MTQIDEFVDAAWEVFNEYYPSEESQIKAKLRKIFEDKVSKEIICAWCGKKDKIEDINKHIFYECDKRPEKNLLKMIEEFLTLRNDFVLALNKFEERPGVSDFLDALVKYGKDTDSATQDS